MRVIAAILVIAVMLCTPLRADDWTPPATPSIDKILREIHSDTVDGRHRDALAKILWMNRTGLNRDSQLYMGSLWELLTWWTELAQKYQPALEAMRAYRDEIRLDVLRGEEADISFLKFVLINDELGDEAAVVADLFLQLRERKRDSAAAVFEVARPYHIETKNNSICVEYIDAESEFRELAQAYGVIVKETKNGRVGLGRFNRAQDNLEYKSAFLIALLAHGSDSATTDSIVAKAKAMLDFDASHAIFDAASKGSFPKNKRGVYHERVLPEDAWLELQDGRSTHKRR